MAAPPELVSADPATLSGRRSEPFAAAMLVVACFCWATFFPLTKNWLNAATDCPGGDLVGCLTFLGIRSVIALSAFALLTPRAFLEPTRHEWRVGLLLGSLNCLGNILQAWGLASTTPALSGFLTSLASLWVPVLALVCFRLPVAGATWVGIVLGGAGLWVLCVDPSKPWGLGLGYAMTVLSSVVFSVFIILLDRLGRTVNSSHLTLILIGTTGLPPLFLALGLSAAGPGLSSWTNWLTTMLRQPPVVRDVLAVTLLSTILATYLMSTYQPRVAASRAALIYLLEPLFASTLSVLIGHDAVTSPLLLGGALILAGNAVAELPVWLRDFRRRFAV